MASIGAIFMNADAIDVLLMSFGFLGAIGDGLTFPLMVVTMSKIVNNIGNHSYDSSLFASRTNESCLILLYIACGSWVSAFLEGYCWTRTGERQASRMRVRYLKAILRQDIGCFDLNVASTSQVVTNVSNDSFVLQDVLSEKIPNLVMNVSTFIGSYVIAFVLLWRLALVGLPFAPLLVIPGLMYGRILMSLGRKMIDEYSNAAMIAQEAISSVRAVYSFAGETRTMVSFSKALDGVVKLGRNQGLAKGFAIGSNGITFAIWSFMAWYGSRLVMYHDAQGGTIFATGASVALGGLSLGTALSNLKCISEACSAAERIMAMIERNPEIDSDNMEGEVLNDVVGDIEFKNVKFAYPSRPVTPIFHDFSLKVPARQTLALVGSSGSGKSTVISLLERFYNPLGGDILLDGVSIKNLQLRWLRLQMALVSQEPALFATSVKANILFGREDASMEEVEAAATAANAHCFISQLPQGYDTQVGEKSLQMSGGQKQRVAIARAIIKRPKILLLDEATSALDSESEKVVQEALDQVRVGRTTIVIAHRLSTIRNADTIAVVEGGQVVEVGTHDSLIKNDQGFYYSLVRLQQMDKEEGQLSIVQESMVGTSSGRSIQILNRSDSTNYVASTQSDQVMDEASSKPLHVPSFRRLFMMNKQELEVALTGCLGAIGFGAIQPTFSFVMASMISILFLQDHSEIESKIRMYSLIFLALSIFSFITNVIEHYSFAAIGEALTKRIRQQMLSKILTFEVGWFDQDENSSSIICSRLAKDANVVKSLVGDRMALVVQTVSAVAIACTLGLVIAWRLAIVMIAVQPIIVACFYTRRVLLKNMSQKSIKSQDESCKLAAEAVSNIRTVTAFSLQSRILNMFELAQQWPMRESIKQSWYAGIGLGTSQSLMACTWALDFWYGGRLIARGYMDAKQLIQTFMVLVSTGKAIADAGSMTTDLAKGADAVAAVFAIIDRCTKIEPDDTDGYKPDTLHGEVQLSQVDFVYPSRPNATILQSFSLNIEAGTSMALVGQSGSGKSAILGLIQRYYDPVKGIIKIDGHDIRSYNLRSLRKHISLVSQEPTLFAGSIRDNIAYGKENASEQEIQDAARIANAHNFIGTLSDGYNTLCGECGVQLSGGEKQRIAIARAILKSPTILLLDEATSALDGQSELAVLEALYRIMVGRTSVIVAHRLVTIQNCDTVAVLENGKVTEKGTHSALLAKGGSYSSLVKIQTCSEGGN